MAKILDLSVFDEKALDIKLLDGSMIHIPTPSQAMVIKMLRLNSTLASKDAEEQLKALNTFVYEVLNSNNGGRHFERDYIENLSLAMKSAIINAYGDFSKELQSDPN